MVSGGEPVGITCVGVFAVGDCDVPIIGGVIGGEVIVHLVIGSIVDACVSSENSPWA